MTTPPMSDELPALAEGFPAPSREAWLALVDKAIKGGDFEKRLVARTADGLRIAPLYTRADTIAGVEATVPGAAPFTRGTRAPGGRSGWDIRQIHAEQDPAAANRAILEDLEGGVTSLILQIAAPGWFGLPYHEDALAAALEGVMLDICPVSLYAGEYTADAAGSLLALWRRRGIAEAARRGSFGADPLGTLALTGALYHPVPRALANAADLVRLSLAMPGVGALVADGHAYHAGGASEAQELAAVLATIAAYLRAAEAAGIRPADALPKIEVTLAVDADQFLGIAKLRAARRLVWRLADACGAGDAVAAMAFTAGTAHRMMSKRDPWVNMLRTTVACAAAAMGGADAITVLPFTWAIGKPDAFARRIARNTHHVLMEESGLGRVADPAGGSWYVERLTDDLARSAWALMQEIEAEGGMAAALASGFVQDRLAASAAARAKAVATGREALTGVSAFPKLGGDGVTVAPWPGDLLSAALEGARVRPLKCARTAEPFEALRDAADAFEAHTGAAPRVFLASLGALAEHGARTTWIANFLAAGGIAAIAGEGYTSSADAGRAFAESGAPIACISAADETAALLAEATAQALKGAGAREVWMAGRPGDKEADYRAAGVDGFIAAGVDALATLARLHASLGVA